MAVNTTVEVVMPPMGDSVSEGSILEWHKQEGDAVSENAKFVARHPTAFERVAVVSDEDWLRPAIKTLSVLLPGEAKAFPVRQLPEAKKWLSEGLDASGSPSPA